MNKKFFYFLIIFLIIFLSLIVSQVLALPESKDNIFVDVNALMYDWVGYRVGDRGKEEIRKWFLGMDAYDNFALVKNGNELVLTIDNETGSTTFVDSINRVEINSDLNIAASSKEKGALSIDTIPKMDVRGNVSWLGTLQKGSVPWSSLVDFPNETCPEGTGLIGFRLDGSFVCGTLVGPRGPRGPRGPSGRCVACSPPGE